MAGAVIEALDAAGARGVFATHLHGLLDLDLDLSPFARRARMETAAVAGGRGGPRENGSRGVQRVSRYKPPWTWA